MCMRGPAAGGVIDDRSLSVQRHPFPTPVHAMEPRSLACLAMQRLLTISISWYCEDGLKLTPSHVGPQSPATAWRGSDLARARCASHSSLKDKPSRDPGNPTSAVGLTDPFPRLHWFCVSKMDSARIYKDARQTALCKSVRRVRRTTCRTAFESSSLVVVSCFHISKRSATANTER